MFFYIVNELKSKLPNREQKQHEHTAYCILFCCAYILCANDAAPDPNKDIIDSICSMLSRMPDIVPLFEAVQEMEDEQDMKGYKVISHNVLAKPHVETAEEAAERILYELKTDIIDPIVKAGFVQQAYKKEFTEIWEDILEDEGLLELMRKEEFQKTYNLKLVVNILALMTYNQTVLKASNNKTAILLFGSAKHYKYFTTEIGDSFSAFESSDTQSMVRSIIERHKK